MPLRQWSQKKLLIWFSGGSDCALHFATQFRFILRLVKRMFDTRRGLQERPFLPLHSVAAIFAHAVFLPLRARAARKTNSQYGLALRFRRCVILGLL